MQQSRTGTDVQFQFLKECAYETNLLCSEGNDFKIRALAYRRHHFHHRRVADLLFFQHFGVVVSKPAPASPSLAGAASVPFIYQVLSASPSIRLAGFRFHGNDVQMNLLGLIQTTTGTRGVSAHINS